VFSIRVLLLVLLLVSCCCSWSRANTVPLDICSKRVVMKTFFGHHKLQLSRLPVPVSYVRMGSLLLPECGMIGMLRPNTNISAAYRITDADSKGYGLAQVMWLARSLADGAQSSSKAVHHLHSMDCAQDYTRLSAAIDYHKVCYQQVMDWLHNSACTPWTSTTRVQIHQSTGTRSPLTSEITYSNFCTMLFKNRY
jgi:hypothetical protein